MRKIITIFLVCACVLLTTTAAWGSLRPVNNMTISFDENGNGSFIDPAGNEGKLDFGVDGTLYYNLPTSAIVEGDVVIYEMGSDICGAVNVSDLLRFKVLEQGSIGRVYVYSDLPEGGEVGELADTGIPTDYDDTFWRIEEGTENGWNGVHYTPGTIEPGYMSPLYPGTVTYIFTSDVPEPATVALMGLGALSLLRKKR